jgi:hypothetical protein
MTDPSGEGFFNKWWVGTDNYDKEFAEEYYQSHVVKKRFGVPKISFKIGMNASIAFYWKNPPPWPAVFVKVSAEAYQGTCCSEDGKEKHYEKASMSITVGLSYGKTFGFKAKITAPIVENLKTCPKPSELKISGILKVSARLSVAVASCTYTYGKGWSCGVGLRLDPKDIFNYRFSVSGGIKASYCYLLSKKK